MPEFRHETLRLVLRDWREADWPVFWEATNTPAVMRWLGGVADEGTRAAAQARVEGYRADHGHTFWVVERKEDGALLGFCGLKRSNQPGGPQGMMEVGWRLREDAWGQGYAKEAASAALDLAFDRFGADEVIALTVHPVPSSKLPSKARAVPLRNSNNSSNERHEETGRWQLEDAR